MNTNFFRPTAGYATRCAWCGADYRDHSYGACPTTAPSPAPRRRSVPIGYPLYSVYVNDGEEIHGPMEEDAALAMLSDIKDLWPARNAPHVEISQSGWHYDRPTYTTSKAGDDWRVQVQLDEHSPQRHTVFQGSLEDCAALAEDLEIECSDYNQ